LKKKKKKKTLNFEKSNDYIETQPKSIILIHSFIIFFKNIYLFIKKSETKKYIYTLIKQNLHFLYINLRNKLNII